MGWRTMLDRGRGVLRKGGGRNRIFYLSTLDLGTGSIEGNETMI